MSKREIYAHELRSMPSEKWPKYLRANSGLPGPRGNLELIQAMAQTGGRADFDALIATGDEYLVCCGVVGLGALLAADAGPGAVAEIEARLRTHASDQRWRVREAVAMALQRLGDADPGRLKSLVLEWTSDADPLVLRAAAAAICEPRLLATPSMAAAAIEVCRRATESLAALPPDSRHHDDVRTLRKGLGYCWSVAVAADPGPGLPVFAALEASPDADVAWIVRENRKKKRLAGL